MTAELKDMLRLCERMGYLASVKEVRRKLHALQRGIDPDAPRIDNADRRPRKRIVWSRPDCRSLYRVKLSCGHWVSALGVNNRDGLKRAPRTAICNTCNPILCRCPT